MQHVEINIVHLKPLQRLLEHLDTALLGPEVGVLVGEFGADEILVAAVAAEGFAHGNLRPRLAVSRSGVEEVEAMLDGIVRQFIDAVLVQIAFGLVAVLAVLGGGEAHAAVAQQRHFLTVGARAVGHLVGRHLACGEAFGTGFVGRVASRRHCCRDQGPGTHAFQKFSTVHNLCSLIIGRLGCRNACYLLSEYNILGFVCIAIFEMEMGHLGKVREFESIGEGAVLTPCLLNSVVVQFDCGVACSAIFREQHLA